LKQGESPISSSYTKMKKLCQELDNFRLIFASNCVDDCKTIEKMCKYKDSNQMIHFLRGPVNSSKIIPMKYLMCGAK